MSDTVLIKCYQVFTRLLGPLTPIWIRKRANSGKEDHARLNERHGITEIDRPEGQLIWFHAASVGESQMILPVIHRFLEHDPDINILVTSGTLTSANILAKRLPDKCVHQFVPLDYPKAVKKFLQHWQPDMAIWTESEIWPNLIKLTKSREIPMVLLNARMSETSLEGWAKRKKTAQSLFGAFDLILAANDKTAKGIGTILDRAIDVPGNLKDAASPLPVDKAVHRKLKSNLAKRNVWCAASTHSGEDELIIAAHQHVLKSYKTACLILAPRHPERRDVIVQLLETAGLSYVTRSSDEPITKHTQVFLFDTIGEMGLAYRLSDVTFVCGSLVEGLSGHNPLEPARLDNAVLTGHHISSFADTYMSMLRFDAVERVLDGDDVGLRVATLFRDDGRRLALAGMAREFTESRDAVLDYVWEKIQPLIP